MATYIPNATQTTEPVESRTVESAALEFRTLKASINGRMEDMQDGLDAEIVNRIAGDANLQTQNNNQDVRIQAIEAALLAIGEGGLPGTVYVQRLSGTGAQTVFTLNVSVPTSALIDIFISGIYQNKDTFTVVDKVLTFSEAPPAGTDNVEVVISITLANVETDASLVGYSPGGIGAVTTNVQTKLREWVSVKDFGAVGDGVTDDTAAIQAAIDSIAGGTVHFPVGTFLISAPIQLRRGVMLQGAGPFDTRANASTKILLKSGSNCAMLQTPAAALGQAEATHFMALENLLFDGNKTGQTTEVTAGVVQFHGAWVGSWIRKVFIYNTLGPGLTLDRGSDLTIDDVWIQAVQTATGYALDTNQSLPAGTAQGLITIGTLYVENTSNKAGGDPRNVEGDRGKAIRLARTVVVSANYLHIEGASHGVDLDGAQLVNINSVSASFVGSTLATDSALIRYLTTIRALNVNTFRAYNQTANTKFVALGQGVSSGNIVQELPIENTTVPFAVNYSSRNADGYGVGRSAPVVFSQLVGQQLVGGASASYYRYYNSDLSVSHYAKHQGEYLRFGSSWGDGIERDMLELRKAASLAANYLCVYDPFLLGARASASGVPAGAVYRMTANVGFGVGPVYQRVVGSNDGADAIMTVRRGAGAPTVNAEYIGQVYVDVSASPRKAYIAINFGAGASDWQQITA